ncbi:hypothetical protein XFF6166_880027 [Xanthomonas citri pv. fuscans]|nr:hypothetical protein XFF6166_880027 [Xanthomonas citri pv. fuscans]SOO04381.1 hypothetical protein XFF6960_970027 [Xanthomonas citri pv. fuscans]SOO08080.1 hypothetical protein XFF6970_150023 [Xanthomonas citri pv. fuscans]SOO45523.1 hypothetical protein XFF1815_840027 [Xanthomonas citri pv. fuscans]
MPVVSLAKDAVVTHIAVASSVAVRKLHGRAGVGRMRPA